MSVNYVSDHHYPDHTATCTICGAIAKPGGKCLSCGSGEQTNEARKVEIPLIVPTDADESRAQNDLAKEYGYDGDNEGWQKLAASCSNYNRATDVLMDLASTEASLTAHRRELLAALTQISELRERVKELEAEGNRMRPQLRQLDLDRRTWLEAHRITAQKLKGAEAENRELRERLERPLPPRCTMLSAFLLKPDYYIADSIDAWLAELKK